jgi:hypothetical protein
VLHSDRLLALPKILYLTLNTCHVNHGAKSFHRLAISPTYIFEGKELSGKLKGVYLAKRQVDEML